MQLKRLLALSLAARCTASPPAPPSLPPVGVTILDFFTADLTANNLGGQVPHRASWLSFTRLQPMEPRVASQGPNLNDERALRYGVLRAPERNTVHHSDTVLRLAPPFQRKSAILRAGR